MAVEEKTERDDYPPIRRFQSDATTAFLRAARSGNLEKVIEYLDTNLDINTANSNGLNALHLASKDGHVEIVTELLKRGAKVDAATKKGNTALHIASLAGQSEIVNILIQYGAAVNIQSQNGFTPLYMAAQENHDQVVKLLLNNGANQSLATEDGFTPLAVAMQQGHDKVVSVLLENDSKGKVRLPALHIAAKKDDCKAADLLLQNDHKPDVTSKSGFTPLHIAAHYGNEEIARLLIKRGADVNYLAKHNISPLHVAAKWGKNNMVKILLENGATLDAKTRDGLTPLHCAARSGHEQCVTTLLESSAPISARTKNGLAPLHMASQGDHVDAARVLLYHRAPVDEVTIDYLTSLHVAAHCGHVRVAKLLLDRKADPNARALNGFTPLHIACKKNRIKVVELLLKHGASIESTTESGLTPLHVASFMGCMNIVIFLLQHEANPDVPTVRGETPLHLAARANQTDIIRILLRNGAKVDARAREQQTPLHIASRLGNVDIVMLLLQHGAAVDTTTKDMYTALHIAAKEGQEEVAAILVDNNASVKATTKNGFTPLHVAAKYGNLNVAKILLQKDSKLDAQGKNDITPLLLACHYDHPNVAQLLLEKGASPHLASQNGQTPLHIAARKNQMDIATTLLEHGAKANVESKAGFTPLHLSAQKGHYDMTNLLIEHGADPNHKAKNGLTALHLCAQEDFIRVASILVKNGANVESETETGYRPIHVAAHFGNLSMIRFLLKHNAEIDVATKQNYTPLHQAAQQGHAHIVSALIEGNANHRARTNDGLTALNIAQKLGYISVMEVLKGLTYDGVTPDNKNWEEKYKVIAPESLQETSLMSDSDDEGGSDALISEQPYRYLTADLMKSLRDDSLPIDVTRDDPLHKQISKEEQQEFVQSNNYCSAENFDSNDFSKFLVSFLVDARGGTMKGTRHSGIRLIVPPRRATMPIRVTCRLVKPSKMANPPPLMEGESLATRVIEMGPVGVQFLGPVLIDIPHFASVRGKEREIIILRSENGETWKEHDNSADNDDTLLNTAYDPQMGSSHMGRITRIITTEFPQYFAIVTRIKQEVHVIGSEGGILISSVASNVQAVFPSGALTKKIKVGLQAHVIPSDLTAKLLGNCVAVSPVITIEPRRRKFHKPISLTLPVPEAANKGMINHYGGETPTLRLLCSIAGGTSEAQWEDVTGSTPLNFMNDRVSFTTTVSARFWLMDCRNVQEVPKMATDLYRESLFVPFITNFVIYSKRLEEVEATLRILCMTDSKEGVPTLEKQEEFLEIVKSRDVETLDGKDLFIEFSGNLIPVTKSGVQLKFTFKAFRQNRLSFHVKVKDPQLDPVARMMFMREPKVAKGDPAQQPLCVLNIVLPEIRLETYKDVEDSNILRQKMEALKASYRLDYGREKGDQPKRTSPTEKKFITDTLQKEQPDAVGSLLAQKAPLESLDASYTAQQELQLSPPAVEKKTYSEKRRFWEDMARSKRESFQRSESEVSHTSQLTYHDSDSEGLSEVRERSEDEGGGHESPIDMGPSVDMSECTVAEKAHYFEEQIQKETTAARGSLKSQSSQESARIAAARLSGISISSEDDRSLEVFEETERILEEKAKLEKENRVTEKVEVKIWEEGKEEKKDEIMEKGERKKSKEEKGLLEKLGLKDSKDKGDLGKKDEKRKSKDEKDPFDKKEAVKEEKKDEKRKSKDEKDLFGKKQDSKEDKSERKSSKGEKELSETKELKGDREKKDSEKKESITKSKFEKVDLPETKKADKLDAKIKTTAKVEPEKESKAKATKMQENVSKQQKAAESKSPVAIAKTTKTKEETPPKPTISKQKSKEESSPKPVPIRQRSKEESFSKSPPKKEKSKDEPLSKSPPKKDKTKDDAASKSSSKSASPKSASPKSASPKTPAKSDKGKDVSPTKKEPPKHEVPKSLIPKREKSKEEFTLKSPPKGDKHKKEIMSPPKSHDDAHKSHIPLRQKSKEEFSLKSPPKETTSPTKNLLKKDLSKEKVKSPPAEPEKNKVEKTQVQEQFKECESVTIKSSTASETVIIEEKKEEIKPDVKDELKQIPSKPTPEEVSQKDAKSSTVSTSIEAEKKKDEVKLDVKDDLKEPGLTSEVPDKVASVAAKAEKVEEVKMENKDESKEITPMKVAPETVVLGDIKPSTMPAPPEVENKKDEIKADIKVEFKETSLNKEVIEKAAPTEVIPEIASVSGDIEKKEQKDQLKETVQKEITDDAVLFELKSGALSEKITKDITSAAAINESTLVQDVSQTLVKDAKVIQEQVSEALQSTVIDMKHDIGAIDKQKDTSITDKGKDSASPAPKREKSIGEIPKSMIPRREKSKEEFTVKSPPTDKDTSIPKRERSMSEIPKSMIPKREKSKDEFTIKSPIKDGEKDAPLPAPKREKSIGEIPTSMIPKREKSKDEFTVKSLKDSEKDAQPTAPKREKSIGEIPKSMIPKREKSKDEFTIKSPPKDEKDAPSTAPKREKSIGEIPKSMIPKREKSKDEFTVKSPPKDEKDATSTAPKREKSIEEIPKSIIPKKEKSQDEFTIKSPSKHEKDVPSTAAKREKSIEEIPKSMIPKREKSKDEFTVKSPPKDEKDATSIAPKREKSIEEIPKSMIPKREKSKDEFTVKSPPKDEKDAPSTAPKREKSIGEIPKSMIPKREKSKDEFTVKSPPKDEKDAPSTAPKREKSIGEIPKSMIPKREKSKDEFTVKSPLKDEKDALSTAPKREKSIGEIPKSMIPKREKSKDEFTVKSPPKDEKDAPSTAPKREKSIGEIPKSMIPKREKSKDEFTVKSPLKDEKDALSTAPKREKSIGEIPKSMIPKREKSKDEFTVKSPPKDEKDAPSTAPKREKSIGEIPKSMIPKREKSKDEFTVKSPLKDEKDALSTAPKREKSIGEIPKSMIPKREKSKDEFTVKSLKDGEKDASSSTPKREKSIGEIPKSMIPKREKSKDEFTVKSPPSDMPSSAPKREKSIGEIPKSMIPKREKSKDEFTVKSPPLDLSSSAPKREKSIGEIPKSMIPKREKSKDEFTVKSPPKDGEKDSSSSTLNREKSIGEIPKSMIPRREKSKDEFTVKSPPTDVPLSAPKREKSIGEIPKSMIPRREKSKDEFSVKSPPKDEIVSGIPKRERSMSEIPKSMIPMREKSSGEIPKSMIPKREKSKEEFGLKSVPKREKSKEELPSTSYPKREKSKDEIPKTTIPKREKSKDEFSSKVLPKREKSKDDIPKTGLARREKSKEEFSPKPAPKREKSKDEIPKSGLARREKSKEEFSTKLAPKREKSKDEIGAKPGIKRSDSKGESSPKSTIKKTETTTKTVTKREDSKEEMKFGAKRRDSKEESPKLSGKKGPDFSPKGVPKREKSKEEIPKTPLSKRRDSKEESPKPVFKRSLSSKDSDSGSSSTKSSTSSPKLADKLSKKDAPTKKEFETVTVTKKEKSEEVTTQEYEEHTRKQTSESQVFSGTFTGDPQEALKLFEDTSALKKADFVTSGSIVTSKVDHKATTSTEKKEVKSSEIDTGEEKIIAHEEKEDIQKKETSASLLTRHSPDEKVEEKECKIKETSVNATQKTLVNLTKDLETVQASASQIGKEKEDSIKRRSVEDYDKIVTTEETLKSLKDSAVGARVKLEKDLLDETVKKDDLGKIIEKSIFQEEVVDSSKTFDVKENLKSKMDELKKDASKSSYEFDKSTSASSIGSMPSKVESPESGTTASEDSHDELADDLTRKFENIMRKSLDAEHAAKVGLSLQEEIMDIGSTRDSVSMSISEDITKDESSSFQLSSSQAKQIERDITMSPSSISEQIEIEELDEHDTNKQKAVGINVKDILASVGDTKSGSKVTAEGKFVSELSGARVLEILEPELESQSRQDSMDVSSIEIDECKFSSSTHDFPIQKEMLHESPAIDSLETLERDVTMSPATFSEDTNIDYSLPRDPQKKHEPDLQKISIKRRTERDSFEIDSPPLVSPRLKIKELEIKPVDWMIGDEKIEVSEPLQPFQAFDKELEEYHSSLKQQQSQEGSQLSGDKPKFEIPRIEETKSTSFEEPEGTKPSTKPKFTVIPVSEQDLEIEKELVENKLDISCQELMDTLQREYDAKTPTDDRLEEMAARSFHFMTTDDDEDSFDYDKEKYEAEGQKQLDEPLKFTDMPLETKTAVNVIEGEQFMRLEDTFKPIEIPGKSKNTELLQLYDEEFEETVEYKDKPSVPGKEAFKKFEMESMSMFEETFQELTDTKKYKQEKKSEVEKPHQFPEPIKPTAIMATPSDKMTFAFDEKSGKVIPTPDKKDDDDDKNKQSYDLEGAQPKPDKSELLLKTETKATEPTVEKEEVQLLSYKPIDPEHAKKQEETPPVTTGSPKPPKTEFHRDSKSDLRSKGWDDHKRLPDKRDKTHSSHETSSYKMKKEDFQNVDMSARYAITVLDQVVKKEIAEVKENLEAAKQDLIEELSENSENVIQIKDSPSEFQFKLQPESIPNELPFLYKAPSLEKVSDAENLSSSSSPIAKPRRHGQLSKDESSSESSSEKKDKDLSKTSIVVESESDKSSQKKSEDIFESFSTSSPRAASRSGSDAEGTAKDETFSLHPPQPAPRRRHKPGRDHRRHVTSESEADISSSGESNYQSCEYESGSRPSSSDVEALQSAAQPSSTTASEYETAMMSFEHSSSKATSQDYHTAVSTLSSKGSMKSLNSLSSGQMGSIDSTSELSETLMASEPEMDKDEIDENLEMALDDDVRTSNYASEDEGGKPFELDPDVPRMMKRSSEMIFSQVITSESTSDGGLSSDVKQSDSSTLTSAEQQPPSTTPSEISDFIKSPPHTATTSTTITTTTATKLEDVTFPTATIEPIAKQPSETLDEPSTSSSEPADITKAESYSFEPDSLEVKCTPLAGVEGEDAETHGPGSGLTLQQQLSMTSSSMSGVSLETVIEKETDRGSDSDSFELVDKPDIIDDFVVIEEVGREAEEYDSEGKGIRISSQSFVSSKNYDRDVENLITEKQQQDTQKPQASSTRSTTGDLFDFESEESPPQASNDDQYSQSFSDEEQYNEGGKKWIEMQFQQNEARLYDLEYERGPLEDIKEEEVTDFEAGSSRFGSVGSQKESIGSIGSMRGSFGSTPDNYDVLTAKRYFKPTDHDNVSLSSLQEFEHLENAVALENAKRREQQHSGSQDSSSNGSLPRRYATSRSGHGDDISLSSVKDFEVLEKACKEAHMIELRAREEEDLLDHESPENRYKLENLARAKVESQGSAAGSFNPSTSGSDDYEKRIKEIDEIIRLAQANVEKTDRHDDTTEDVSQIELTDTGDKPPTAPVTVYAAETSVPHAPAKPPTTTTAVTTSTATTTTDTMNLMETSTDSLELEGIGTQNYNVMCRSSDSLELKTTLDYPSLSSDSLNNVKDPKEELERQFSNSRRISSDSLEFPVLESQDDKGGKDKDKDKGSSSQS